MVIKKLSNSELTKELIKDIPGLFYYPNFITEKHAQQISDTLDSLDYQIINGKPTKNFGLNYTYRKKTHDEKVKEIPHFFNLLEPINIKVDQISIEYFRNDDSHSYIRESDIFYETLIIPIGSHFKYNFMYNENIVEFLMEPNSLLYISKKARGWKRSIKSRVKERYNNTQISRSDFYLFTFRNLCI
jgi:hypothetical protein